jgi:hypothetical protein
VPVMEAAVTVGEFFWEAAHGGDQCLSRWPGFNDPARGRLAISRPSPQEERLRFVSSNDR